MELYAALDVSLEKTSICVLDREGEVVTETIVASDPAEIAGTLQRFGGRVRIVGLEAGPLSEWIVRGLGRAGIGAVLMETRQVHAALSAMIAKTDRNDASGWPICCASAGSGRCM